MKKKVEAVGEEFNFKKMFSSKAEDSPKRSDITICTYVSPWAFHESETPEDQQRFRDFLKQTMKDRGFLISVDPERTDTSDRARTRRHSRSSTTSTMTTDGSNSNRRGRLTCPTLRCRIGTSCRGLPPGRTKVTGALAEAPSQEGEGADVGLTPEEEEGDDEGKEETGIEQIQMEYLTSLMSVLRLTRCASRDADASKMYYSPLRFVDGEVEFWKNVGEDEFEEMEWEDFWGKEGPRLTLH